MPLPHTVGNALVAGGAAPPAESHLARTDKTSNSCGKTTRLRFSDAFSPAVLIRRFARKRSHTIDKQVSTHQTDARHRHTIDTQCASHRTDTRGRYVDTRNQHMRNTRKTGMPTQRRATARQPVGGAAHRAARCVAMQPELAQRRDTANRSRPTGLPMPLVHGPIVCHARILKLAHQPMVRSAQRHCPRQCFRPKPTNPSAAMQASEAPPGSGMAGASESAARMRQMRSFGKSET